MRPSSGGGSTGRRGVSRFLLEMFHRYREHDISRQSAALSYYLLFALFPILIFLSSLLGVLHLDVDSVLDAIQAVLPNTVVELCGAYLDYVSQTASSTLLWFSLVFSIYFPMRAANCLMMGVRRAYGLDVPGNLLLYYLRLLMYTIFLIVLVTVALVLAMLGQQVLLYFTERIDIPVDMIRIWHYLRFAVLAVILFAILGLLYTLAQDRPQKARGIVPGTLISLLAWVLLSMGFSFYTENFANYSLIYGALGAVVVLMVWLYFSAATLLLGAELNALLLQRRQEKDAVDGGN